jgi:hypothetical protein
VRQAEDRLAAGPRWQDGGLVFASTAETPLDDHDVRPRFRVTTPRLRDQATSDTTGVAHTLASLVSAHGVLIETIALPAGRHQTATTELAYRHQIDPAMPRS